jgi:hypothetical protein
MRGPATTIIRSPGTSAAAIGVAVDGATQQVAPDPGAADADDADLLVGLVAELGTDGLDLAELTGVEAGDVAGEVEVRRWSSPGCRADPDRTGSVTTSSPRRRTGPGRGPDWNRSTSASISAL